ncbi:putative cytoplasmic protein [Escherichia coli H454]|nr:putative cytoplasmic protein [Escherichia coli H454]
MRRQQMEFHENKANAPFIGFVQLWQAVRRWRRQMQARRVLQQMSDERLRDIGLRREDVE